MDDLNVTVAQSAGKIEFSNYEEICKQLSEQMEIYKNLDFKEEDKAVAKKDLATLRKIKKAVDDRRKEIKKDFMTPYEEFETKVKRLISLIDEPILLIDSKVSEFEEKRKKEKMDHVAQVYKDAIGDMEEILPYSRVYKEQWLNATYTDTNIQNDISEMKVMIQSNLSIIRSMDTDCTDKAVEIYLQSYELSKAVDYINTYEANKKAILAKQEEEKRIAEEKAKEETFIAESSEPNPVVQEPVTEEETFVCDEESKECVIVLLGTDEEIDNAICLLVSNGIDFERR